MDPQVAIEVSKLHAVDRDIIHMLDPGVISVVSSLMFLWFPHANKPYREIIDGQEAESM